MSANEVQVNYEQMNTNGKQAGELSQQMRQVSQRINSQLDNLKGGNWVGNNANKFYQEMDNTVMPAMQRLIDALSETESVVNTICRIFEGAEEEGSAGFPSA